MRKTKQTKKAKINEFAFFKDLKFFTNSRYI